MKIVKLLTKDIATQNPVLIGRLGLCSAIAVTTTWMNGLGMGIAVMLVLVLSGVIISALRTLIPDSVRPVSFLVIIAALVTVLDLLLQAFFPELSESLGLFVPLIAVNGIVLSRTEKAFEEHSVLTAFCTGVFQGIGCLLVLLLMGSIREILGFGTFGSGLIGAERAGVVLFPAEYAVGAMTTPVGGFLMLGLLAAALQWILVARKK